MSLTMLVQVLVLYLVLQCHLYVEFSFFFLKQFVPFFSPIKCERHLFTYAICVAGVVARRMA